ncbi:MAG TPA: hypothetical protein VNK41_13055 [Vicinamibacterales bacterium]|nr:hypothetical protein [Vicinamibacterales bacterium]
MRRFTLGAISLASLLILYSVSPIAAWVTLLGSVAFFALRRSRSAEAQRVSIER